MNGNNKGKRGKNQKTRIMKKSKKIGKKIIMKKSYWKKKFQKNQKNSETKLEKIRGNLEKK